jgi:hypothetical protein
LVDAFSSATRCSAHTIGLLTTSANPGKSRQIKLKKLLFYAGMAKNGQVSSPKRIRFG